MIIKELHVKNYRNLTEITLSPCERINVIYGDNAQGKTNIIEAIWLFTGNASFRSAKLNELIQFDCKQAELSVLFEDGQREQNAKMKLSAKKEIHLNQVPLKKPASWPVIFSAWSFLRRIWILLKAHRAIAAVLSIWPLRKLHRNI